MARTLVDVDPELLSEAGRLLGTRTKKDTVVAALREVVTRAARQRELDVLLAGGWADQDVLSTVRDDAWRR